MQTDTVKEIMRFDMFKSFLGLERINKLLGLLGNPQNDLKVIQVAGTNGKGSVTAMLSSILSTKYKVGSFYSPHIVDYYERIQINNVKITDDELKRVWAKVKQSISQMSDTPTFFEIATAIALVYFQEQKVDFAVLEVGLGGRLDATTASNSNFGIITNVSLDHTELLGETIKQIAFEKAGIINDQSIVLLGDTNPEVVGSVEDVCKSKNVKLYLLDNLVKLNDEMLGHEIVWAIKSISNKTYKTNLGLKGYEQGRNACLAIAMAEIVDDNLDETKIENALSQVYLPGRLEVVDNNPLILFDGAHNPSSMQALVDNLKLFDYAKIIWVCGMMKDKDRNKMFSILGPKVNAVITTKILSNPVRSSLSSELKQFALQYCDNVHSCDDFGQAYELAKKLAHENDLILVAGSLYLIGDAKKYII